MPARRRLCLPVPTAPGGTVIGLFGRRIGLLQVQIGRPQAEITFFADIEEVPGILQMKNLRGQFLLNIERDDRTKRSVPMSNFVLRNVSNLRFAGERRDAQRFLVIFFLIELKNVRVEVIPIDQSGLLGIEADDERSSFIRFDDFPCRTISLIDCRID